MAPKPVNALPAEGGRHVVQVLQGMDVVKSQAESLRRRSAWSKRCLVDLRRPVRQRVRESKTEMMLARGASIFLTYVLACVLLQSGRDQIARSSRSALRGFLLLATWPPIFYVVSTSG